MSKPTKAYILKINDATSEEYAKTCSDSCDSAGMEWEYFQGFQNMSGKMAWSMTGLKLNFFEEYKRIDNPSASQKAECCSAGHAAIWKKIANGPDEAAIILEHDSLLLHKIDIDVPDNNIVVLGYKVTNPNKYDYVKAGPPKSIIPILGHEGAHAYAITKNTARLLIEEIEQRGLLGCIDNAYFIRKQRKTSIPISIMSPTPAIGWLRKSTIWKESADRNYQFIESFSNCYSRN